MGAIESTVLFLISLIYLYAYSKYSYNIGSELNNDMGTDVQQSGTSHPQAVDEPPYNSCDTILNNDLNHAATTSNNVAQHDNVEASGSHTHSSHHKEKQRKHGKKHSHHVSHTSHTHDDYKEEDRTDR